MNYYLNVAIIFSKITRLYRQAVQCKEPNFLLNFRKYDLSTQIFKSPLHYAILWIKPVEKSKLS